MHRYKSPDDVLSDESADRRLQQIAALRANILEIERENVLLRKRLEFEKGKAALMQAALKQCRPFVERSPIEEKPARGLKFTSCAERLFAKLRWAHPKSKWGPAEIGLPRKGDGPRYIVRSDLETLILRTATIRVGGILGVVIEIKLRGDGGSGAEWHVSGVISGMAERNVATEAVTQAASQYADWIVVEDGSHLNGQAVAEIRPLPPSAVIVCKSETNAAPAARFIIS